ncbi:ABC transporter substrate-binding protein [Thermovenabulum gondwanense]|uniref:Leucine-, isoleucine-, valine-, threonine-, and alanine-binding protein n=1 Tax=Thermovenabulum gondwanense TaxID=520767 RepID=A0A161PUT4_9FIRM|nr:ABC transporter substrate-binding protein [Thermovenabulum gondwanense]KYO66535.1 Leucine-, isoleucine-, valine-, threonine-, and alanine-binding protein [Thermovenabulum gondwanense]
MKKKLAVIVALLLIATLILPGCSQQAQKPAEQQEIKIGAILPLTGSAAATGVKLKYAIETAEEIINGEHPEINMELAKSAGLPNLKGAKIKFIFADHQANPEIAKSEAERLIQNEKVVGLIGCYHSSATKPASQVAERFQIPFVAGSSSSAALTERGLKWFTRIAPHDGMETKFFFDYLKYLNEKFNAGIKKIAVVYIDNEYGVHAFQMVQKTIENYKNDGFELVLDVKYPANVSNVDTEVQKVKAAAPDAIFHASYIGDMTMFVKKYKELNVVPKVVLSYCGGYQDPQFVKNLGKDADYFAGPNATTSALFSKMPDLAKINEIYKKKSGVDIDGPTLEDFASAMVIAEAINKAGTTDPAKVMEVLKSTEFSAPYFVSGKIKFGEDGQNIYSASVMTQIQNGIYEAVWPENFQTKQPIPAFPEWNKR